VRARASTDGAARLGDVCRQPGWERPHLSQRAQHLIEHLAAALAAAAAALAALAAALAASPAPAAIAAAALRARLCANAQYRIRPCSCFGPVLVRM
jgi:hypothetical protein